jgi:hypothetical protein
MYQGKLVTKEKEERRRGEWEETLGSDIHVYALMVATVIWMYT